MIKQWAFVILRPIIFGWLRTRALVLPKTNRESLIKQLGITDIQLKIVENEIQVYAVSQVDSMLEKI